jgi:uncharacterized protein YfaS (alpha-2-macroglobulin family)
VRLASGRQGDVTVPIAAAGPGDAVLTVRLTGPDVSIDQRFAIRIQPGTSALVRRTVWPLEPGGSVQVTGDLLADILPGTGAVSVSVSPLAALDVPGLLQSLDRYPYGCSEQIVSRALPLLYVNRLASASALGLDGQLDERVRNAIERVLARQDSNGSFGLWGVGGSDDLWLDAYVTDFLTRPASSSTRCRSAPSRRRSSGCATSSPTRRRSRARRDLAYAAYVLARNGRPVAGDLRYLADTKLASFTTPLARAQIAAALGAARRPRPRADRVRVRGRAAAPPGTARPGPITGTRLRDGAALVALASEAGGAGTVGRDAPRHRGGARAAHLHVDAGERLDGARRRRPWRADAEALASR